MNEELAAICAGLRERFPEHVSEPETAFGEVSVRVRREGLVEACRHLRDDVPFELLSDLSGVDYLDAAPPEDRFLVAYHLTSLSKAPCRLRLRVFVPQGDERLPSVTPLWPTANWQEREVFDFFGIRFEGHPDMRRILMPDDWDGHPHRKDYPLGGTNVEYKGAFIPPPDLRKQPTTTTGYPGRIG
jgi:NADH-quinone oxidoreductase subunit C